MKWLLTVLSSFVFCLPEISQAQTLANKPIMFVAKVWAITDHDLLYLAVDLSKIEKHPTHYTHYSCTGSPNVSVVISPAAEVLGNPKERDLYPNGKFMYYEPDIIIDYWLGEADAAKLSPPQKAFRLGDSGDMLTEHSFGNPDLTVFYKWYIINAFSTRNVPEIKGIAMKCELKTSTRVR